MKAVLNLLTDLMSLPLNFTTYLLYHVDNTDVKINFNFLNFIKS